MKIYLDNNATTRIDDRVLQKMLPYFQEAYGNPNSTHAIGQQAKIAVDEAREIIAAYIHALPVEVLFTGSSTESNNWAWKGVAEAQLHKGKHIITTAIEHSSIMKTAQHLEELGYDITYLPVNEFGHISIEDFQNALRDDTIFVSIQYANSEVGSILPVRDIGKICQKRGIVMHSDATQAAKYLELFVEHLKVNLLTIGAHKINGPKGIGCLYIQKRTPIVQLLDGGQQEFNLRAGTENVPLIVGFGEAITLLSKEREERAQRVEGIRNYFEKLIKENIPDVLFNGGEPRMPNISSIAFLGTASDSLLVRLDMEGIYASAGSACTSGSIQISEVLKAMGFDERRASSTLRFSFSHENSTEEVEETVEKLTRIVSSLRAS